MRAIGILSGMATNLDPEFDPWTETIPFAERLAADELQRDWQGWLQEFVAIGQLLFRLPGQLDRVLALAERGNLAIQTSLAPDARKAVDRLERAVNRLTWMVVTIGLLIAGVNLYVGRDGGGLGLGLMAAALVALVWGIFRR